MLIRPSVMQGVTGGVSPLPLQGETISRFTMGAPDYALRAFQTLSSGSCVPAETAPLFGDSPQWRSLRERIYGIHRLLHHTRLEPGQAPFVVDTLASLLGEGRRLWTAVYDGSQESPSPPLMKAYVGEWISLLNDIRMYGLCIAPLLMRKIFWEEVRAVSRAVPPEIILEAARENRCAVSEPLTLFIENRILHEAGVFNQDDIYWGNLRCLTALGLLPPLEHPDGNPVPPGEEWPEGKSFYVRRVLEPAFLEAAQHVCRMTTDTTCLRRNVFRGTKALLDIFSSGLRLYQKLKSRIPYAPEEVLLMYVSAHLYEVDTPPFSKEIFYKRFSTLLHLTARHLAAFPPRIFDSCKESIQRDFPEACFYREGLTSFDESRRAEIAGALQFREDDKTVLHIGVRGDMRFVKETLLSLPAGGKVILVDKFPEVFQPFLEDAVLRKAYLEGRLVLEEADYHGAGSFPFRNRYRGKADRVYLLHPVGNPAPVMEEIVAPGGLVIYQNSDKQYGRRYLLYDYPLFSERGSFRKITGYVNGPPYFRTETALNVGALGVRFSVARRGG